MKRFSRYQNPTTFFVDMLTLIACAFGLLFVLAVMRMAVEKTKKNVEVKAEFIITMTWPDGIRDDIDSWVEGPTGHICSFNQREAPLMSLDRDDQGHLTDTVKTPYGTTITYKGNREVVTIRGGIPGEYIVNAHVYRKNSTEPCKVMVQLDKINPFGIVKQQELEFFTQGEEQTAFRFRVNGDGEIIEINRLPKSIAVRHNSEEDLDLEGARLTPNGPPINLLGPPPNPIGE